jgi:hypothetical protein
MWIEKHDETYIIIPTFISVSNISIIKHMDRRIAKFVVHSLSPFLGSLMDNFIKLIAINDIYDKV